MCNIEDIENLEDIFSFEFIDSLKLDKKGIETIEYNKEDQYLKIVNIGSIKWTIDYLEIHDIPSTLSFKNVGRILKGYLVIDLSRC